MKFASQPIGERHEHSGTSEKAKMSSSSSLSAITKTGSTRRLTPSRVPTNALSKSKTGQPRQVLSRSMESVFRKMQKSAIARDAYIQAEVSTFIAHQIRAIRQQRGLSQQELATQLKTTQTAVSRLEDPTYGRMTIKTLMDLARVFDVGLQVKFVSFVTMLQNTYFASRSARDVPSFEEDSQDIGFYDNYPRLLSLSMGGGSGSTQPIYHLVTPLPDPISGPSPQVFNQTAASTVSIAFPEQPK